MAQLVKQPTSAQVMISRFMSSSPTSESVLTTQSLEPASDSVPPSLSVTPLLVLSLSLSLKKKKKIKIVLKRPAKDIHVLILGTCMLPHMGKGMLQV